MASVAILLVSYIGSYLALLSPLDGYNGHLGFMAKMENYRLGGNAYAVRRFFGPMHWVDERLRPTYWEAVYYKP